MYTKILILTTVSLFSCLSSGMCPDDLGPNYYYISPEIDTQLDVDQVFVVKNKGLTMVDSFPSFCSDRDDKQAINENLNPDQMFMIIGSYLLPMDDGGMLLSDGYFKLRL